MYDRNECGKTALHLAVGGGHWEIVKRFLEHRRFKWKNVAFQELVAEAVEASHHNVASKLIQSRPEFIFKDPNVPIYIERCRSLAASLQNCDPSNSRAVQQQRDFKVYQEHLMVFFEAERRREDVKQSSQGQGGEDVQSSSNPLEDMLSLLECPVCLDEMFEVNIASCSNDHWLCGSCLEGDRIKECPSCREDFGETPPLKKYTAEKVAAVVLRMKTRVDGSSCQQ